MLKNRLFKRGLRGSRLFYRSREVAWRSSNKRRGRKEMAHDSIEASQTTGWNLLKV